MAVCAAAGEILTIIVPIFEEVGTTKLFRAGVSPVELASVNLERKITLMQGGIESKYFARTLEDSHWYEQYLFPDGYHIIKAEIFKVYSPKLKWSRHGDGVGAFIFERDELQYIKPKIK